MDWASLFRHINFIELLAVLVAAMAGIHEARKKGLDIVGVFFVGFVTALGGGTIRDVLINRHPVFWMQNELFPVSILFLSLLSMIVIRREAWDHRAVKWPILVLDAMSLALFSVVGTDYALQKECSFSVCVLMGIITGTFGGVARDIICNEIPFLFRPSQLYATCSFFGSVLYVALVSAGINPALSVAAGIG
ncbi:MAG: trimeric intracellular cation channel family protein, partial [Chitinispirillaceae bacterium]|nr:trimeric intracellular cation channel family protein [Chitinispirillaceae bacterium]